MIIECKSGNTYLYTKRYNQLLLLHPIIKYFIYTEDKGIDIENQVSLHLKGEKSKYFSDISPTALKYYYKKFKFLKERSFFRDADSMEDSNLNIDSDSVRYFLANTPHVTFEVTDSCNLACKYCSYREYYSNFDKRGNKKLSVSIGKRMLDYLVPLWNSNLNSSHKQYISLGFYGGEPLLNFSFIKRIVEYAGQIKLKRHKFIFNMTTNGVLLDRHMDFIVENNFQLLISLDGDQRNSSYRVYQNGFPAFKSVFSNIVLLQKKYPEYFKEKVKFNSVLHDRNSIEDILIFFWNNFGKRPNISELTSIGLNPALKDKFLQIYRNYNENMANVMSNEKVKEILSYNDQEDKSIVDFFSFYCGYTYDKYRYLRSPGFKKFCASTGTCFPFTKKTYITVNGKIFPCERIGHNYALGYVNEHGIELDFEHIAQVYNQYFNKLKKKCVDCSLYSNCPACIFDLDIDENKPSCHYFMDCPGIKEKFASLITRLEETPGLYAKSLKRYYEE